MPDDSFNSDIRKTTNPPRTKVCRDLHVAFELRKLPSQEYELTRSGEPESVIHMQSKPRTRYSARKPEAGFPDEADRKRKSPVVQAFVIALSICAFQVIAMLIAFLLRAGYPLMMLYFYTSSPSQLLTWTGIEVNGGFFNWPTNLGFGLGLAIWGCVYFFVVLTIIVWRRKRSARNVAST